MKRIVALLLVFVMAAACMAGCDADPEPTESTGIPMPSAPNHQGSSLIEYDPDREIYFTSGVYRNFYTSFESAVSFGFRIYSKEPIDLDTLKVTVPTTHPYEIITGGGEIARGTEYSISKQGGTGGMPFYVYQAYQGIDFYHYSPNSQQVKTVMEEFKKLAAEDVPQIYSYYVEVRLGYDPMPDEEIPYVDITIGDQTYRHDIGEIRLFSAENSPYNYKIIYTNGSENTLNLLYNDGIGEFKLFGDFTAEEDMTVRGFDLLGSDCEILDFQVSVKSGGTSMSYDWDRETPIELYAGDTITFSVVFHDSYLELLHYDILMQGILNVEVEGQMRGYLFEKRMRSKTDPYEVYAIVFDGVDMEPYYRGYYYENFELWRKEYSKS